MEQNRVNKSSKIKLIVLFAIILLFAISGVTFAYFTTQVSGNEEASSVEIITAELNLIYTDLQISSGASVRPGWSETKTITVENDGTEISYYDIIWRELDNSIVWDELVLYATCTASSGECYDIYGTPVPETDGVENDIPVVEGIPIEPGVTHTYTLTVEFIETGLNQNYNQHKEFYGTLNISESVPISRTPRLVVEVPDDVEYVEDKDVEGPIQVSDGSVSFSQNISVDDKVTYHTIIGYDSNNEEVFNKVLGFRMVPGTDTYIDNDVISLASIHFMCYSVSATRTVTITFDQNYDVSVAYSCTGGGGGIIPINPGGGLLH